jgi:iron(III) transport system substrate-binding protein
MNMNTKNWPILRGAGGVAIAAIMMMAAGCGVPAANPAQPAADDAVASVANYAGDDRQKFLEEGARKEGKLTVFSSTGSPAIDKVVEAFEAKYPYIDVDVPCCLNSPSDVTTRALAELQSGRSNIGVVETFASGINALRQAGMFTTFVSPNSKLQIEEATDVDGYYLTTRSNQRGLAVNTDKIPLADAPKSWDEMVQPEWKGRVSIAGGEAATRLVAYLQDTQPKETLEKFAAQEPQVVEVTARALADMLVSGEVELSPTITRAHIQPAIDKGAPVAWIPVEPVDSISTAIALPAKSPAPHSAMLFIDFITSLEGQKIYVGSGYDSLAPELMRPEDKDTELVFLDGGVDYLDRSNELADLVSKLFR